MDDKSLYCLSFLSSQEVHNQLYMWSERVPALGDFLDMAANPPPNLSVGQAQTCGRLVDAVSPSSGPSKTISGSIFKVEIGTTLRMEEKDCTLYDLFPPAIKHIVEGFSDCLMFLEVSSNVSAANMGFDLRSRWMRADDLAIYWNDQVLPWAECDLCYDGKPRLMAVRLFALRERHLEDAGWSRTEVARLLHMFYPEHREEV